MNLEILKEEEACYSLKELLDLYANYIKNPQPHYTIKRPTYV